MTRPVTSDEIRDTFVSFFAERGHVTLPSWPLVPVGDPSSLFTSAGMQQFKPIFRGEVAPQHPRVTTVQRCFRTTDIEEVGDLSHLTMFEMLGNFSFGDYFKAEVIPWAWELLTQVYEIPPERLHVTIYLDDDEAHDIWRSVGVPESRIHRHGEAENYWFAGPTGPCGPDSEIYYDYFPENGLDGIDVTADGDRFLEIWNLVFMQLEQHEDGTRTPLPRKNIDTGSGLERIAAVQQGKRSVFETDAFLPILERAAGIAGVDYLGGKATPDEAYAIRAMAEHCRAATMLIADGVVPSNEGRGYVLRRIIRRAIYFARSIGVREPFTTRIADAAIAKMSGGYPHLLENRDFIERALQGEEERFLRTLDVGSQRLDAVLARLESTGERVVPGEEAFMLYDTYGLPLELTRELASRRGFDVDTPGYNAALEAQRERARQAGGGFHVHDDRSLLAGIESHSAFTGYTHTEADSQVRAILRDGQFVEIATPGESYELVLDVTPFYPEGGGQIGDRGTIRAPSGIFIVEDTQTGSGGILHRGRVEEGELRVHDRVNALVDTRVRRGTTYHHTATHLLHAGLRRVLGSHVRQQGSLVTPDRLRFDFTHLEQAPREALIEVEQMVNDKVRHNLGVEWRMTSYQDAIESGALAFFGDKYGAEVRVVEIRDDGRPFSAELCGGTHVHHTGELGFIHIVRESAVAAGVRRIEALTGAAAERYFHDQQEQLLRIASRLGSAVPDIEDRIENLQAELQRLRRQNEELERLRAGAATDSLLESAQRIGDAHLVVGRATVANADALKDVADRLRKRLEPAVLVLGADIDGRAALLVAASPELVQQGINAGSIIREVAKVAGGGGGGRPDIAQAGAKDASKLDDALAHGRDLARAALEGVGT